MNFRYLQVFSVMFVMGAQAHAGPEKVLFIGNSYTGQIRSALTKFFTASPYRTIKLEFINPGGRTLKEHSGNSSTMERISDGDWDIVVLQDQSQNPAVFPKNFFAASEKLHQAISRIGAKTAYYQTWGRRDGDKKNALLFATYTKMQDALSRSYTAAAKRDGAILVPVGEAWRAVRESDKKLGLELYKGDGSHPSAKGAYLAACCFYAALTGGDPRRVEFDGGLPASEAQAFREISRKLVTGSVSGDN